MKMAQETLESDMGQELARALWLHERYCGISGCPTLMVVDLIRRKWAVNILFQLFINQEPMRFNSLERAIAPITQKELSKRLHELEAAEIVNRTIYPEVPPRVEYTLTERGLALIPILNDFTRWAEMYEVGNALPVDDVPRFAGSDE
jgi:DNA-binding HxlR family transcriptional regulator